MIRIGIAGAGIAGRLLAWQLGRLGHDVEVFDPAPGPDAPAAADAHGAAAFAAAGMLSPLAELENASDGIAERGWRSLDLWPGIIAALGPSHRTPSLFRRNGSLLVAHAGDAGAVERLLARVRAAQIKDARVRERDEAAERALPGLPTPLAADALGTLEPALAPGLRGWLLPGEGQVDAARLLPALCEQSPRVRWNWDSRVDRVESHQLHFAHARSRGFDIAVDVRGLGARPALPLRGVRGELLWLHAPGLELRRPIRHLHARHRICLVPRHGDVVLVGTTEIDDEDRSPVSVRSALELLSAAHGLVPQLAEARILRLDAQLRPATADQRPLLHVDDGLIRINGLFRHGFLLAPALVEEALQRSGLLETAHLPPPETSEA
jgi:glycine oxidase